MSLINPANPKELRTALHTGYERYALGLDMFPRVRLSVPAEMLPVKSQAIAFLLERAWERIDEDNAYFSGAANKLVDLAIEQMAKNEFGGPMLAITQVGRHCVKVITVTPRPDKPEAVFGKFSRSEFVETFEGAQINMTDGRTVTLRDGKMEGDFDAAVVRGSNVSGFMLPRHN